MRRRAPTSDVRPARTAHHRRLAGGRPVLLPDLFLDVGRLPQCEGHFQLAADHLFAFEPTLRNFEKVFGISLGFGFGTQETVNAGRRQFLHGAAALGLDRRRNLFDGAGDRGCDVGGLCPVAHAFPGPAPFRQLGPVDPDDAAGRGRDPDVLHLQAVLPARHLYSALS